MVKIFRYWRLFKSAMIDVGGKMLHKEQQFNLAIIFYYKKCSGIGQTAAILRDFFQIIYSLIKKYFYMRGNIRLRFHNSQRE